MAALDQAFTNYGAKLNSAFATGPYDRWAHTGDEDDPAIYLAKPGVNFMRPWLAIRNGPAFQWPIGMQGVNLSIEPTLGIHKSLGDNTVDADVLHSGEEHFTLSGNFPGNSAPDLIKALRDVVYHGASREGKLLWMPEVVSNVQKVQVVRFEADRAIDDRGRDFTYSIEFVRLGIAQLEPDPDPVEMHPQPTHPAKGKSAHHVKVDAKHNTLRKIAAWKLGGAKNWRRIYNANQAWFVKRGIPLAKAPTYRIPVGTTIHY